MTDCGCVAGQKRGSFQLCAQKAKHKGFLFLSPPAPSRNHDRLAHVGVSALTQPPRHMLTVAKMKLKVLGPRSFHQGRL